VQPTDAENELLAYTLAHRDPAFVHQHAVDAMTAQRADAHTKPIALVFALVGLYLHLEKGVTGRQVQRIHQRLAQHREAWPTWPQPTSRGTLTAADVLAQPAGPDRDRALAAWCATVWAAYADTRPAVIAWLAEHGIE
jgi:hypothetical protein